MPPGRRRARRSRAHPVTSSSSLTPIELLGGHSALRRHDRFETPQLQSQMRGVSPFGGNATIVGATFQRFAAIGVGPRPRCLVRAGLRFNVSGRARFTAAAGDMPPDAAARQLRGDRDGGPTLGIGPPGSRAGTTSAGSMRTCGTGCFGSGASKRRKKATLSQLISRRPSSPRKLPSRRRSRRPLEAPTEEMR
jgi:hypothetical protein